MGYVFRPRLKYLPPIPISMHGFKANVIISQVMVGWWAFKPDAMGLNKGNGSVL